MAEENYGPPIKCTYGGNDIYLDQGRLSDVRNEINLMNQKISDQNETCKNIDTWFDDIDKRYKSLFPSPRYAEIASLVEIFTGAGGAVQNIQDELNRIEGAIVDYSNGDGFFDLNNNQFLNDLLGVNEEPTEYVPPASPTGPSDDDEPPTLSDDEDNDGVAGSEDTDGDGVPDNEETDNNNSTDNGTNTDANGSNSNSDDSNNNAGFGMFYPDSDSASEPSASTAAKLATMMGVEDLDGDGEIDAEELSSAFTSFGTSGNSSFFVPSLTSSKTDGVKSSGVIGAAGVVAAAAAAIAGKVYYDKQKEDDDDETIDEGADEDEDKDEIVALEEETGSEILEEESMSNLNMVEFKEELLHIGEDDE